MDLNDLIPSTDTLVVELTYKDKPLLNEDGSPMTIEVYLPHSKTYRNAHHKQKDYYLNRGQEEGYDSAKMEQLGLEFLAETTKTWDITFGEDENGNKVKPKFSKKKALEIYDSLQFIPELILSKVNAAEAFT